jgi:hypothetical protein
MSTNKSGEGAPLFIQPGTRKEKGVAGEKKTESKKPLPRFAVVPHRGKGRVLGYEGEGYFLVKIPGKPQIIAHRRDLTFTNKAEEPSKKTKKPQKPPQAEPA